MNISVKSINGQKEQCIQVNGECGVCVCEKCIDRQK